MCGVTKRHEGTEMSVPLFFVRRFGSTASGSTQMRGTNLPNLVDHYVGANLKVRRISAPSHNKPWLQRLWAQAVPKDAIYFMTKGLLKMDREAALILKSRVRAVCYDYVDQEPTRVNSDQADIHVCSSFAQKDQLEALQEQA